MTTAAVVTVSSRAAAGASADEAGPAVAGRLREEGFDVGDVVVVPDGRNVVAAAVVAACSQAVVVFTCGGTGISPSDVTPEATADVIDRVVPGIAEAMRAASLTVTPMAMLSRGIAGVRGGTLVVNLPGSTKAALENLEVCLGVLGHAVDQLAGGDHAR